MSLRAWFQCEAFISTNLSQNIETAPQILVTGCTTPVVKNLMQCCYLVQLLVEERLRVQYSVYINSILSVGEEVKEKFSCYKLLDNKVFSGMERFMPINLVIYNELWVLIWAHHNQTCCCINISSEFLSVEGNKEKICCRLFILHSLTI